MDSLRSPRILIVRLSAIGDVIHGLPVLNALRVAYPQAHLGWVVSGKAGDLLEGHPALDELIRIPRRWLRSPREAWALRRRLKASKFEIAIDLQGLTKSALAARLSGASRRIGFGGADGRELSGWLNNQRVQATAAHVIDRNLELLGALDILKPKVEFNLPESASDAATAEGVLAQLGIQRPFAIINPGAGWPSKLWPTERFAAVARHLAPRMKTLVVWAGSDEHRMAEEIVAGSRGGAVLAPSTTLREVAALARRARLFIASDTGPLHLAVAVGTPSLGLFGPMPAERNGPYGPQHIALQKMRLTGGSRQRRSAGPESMLAISVADVCHACDEILSRDVHARHCA
jgi:lipopolysaccharide heptosyltransferase I